MGNPFHQLCTIDKFCLSYTWNFYHILCILYLWSLQFSIIFLRFIHVEYQNFIPFYFCVVFHCMTFPTWEYSEWSWYKHSSINHLRKVIFLNFSSIPRSKLAVVSVINLLPLSSKPVHHFQVCSNIVRACKYVVLWQLAPS